MMVRSIEVAIVVGKLIGKRCSLELFFLFKISSFHISYLENIDIKYDNQIVRDFLNIMFNSSYSENLLFFD